MLTAFDMPTSIKLGNQSQQGNFSQADCPHFNSGGEEEEERRKIYLP